MVGTQIIAKRFFKAITCLKDYHREVEGMRLTAPLGSGVGERMT